MLVTQLMTTVALALSPVQAQSQPPAASAPAGQAAPAGPAAAAKPTAGAAVFDPAGAQVGKIDSLTADAAVIDNGTHKAAVPLSAFSAGANGLTITLTKAQFDSAAAQQAQASQAQLRAQLVAGAQVRGADGTTVIGTVKATDATLVTLTTPKGEIRVPMTGFAAGPNGLVVGLTAQQLEQATASAGAAQTPPSR
jgi:hypothetical protein